MSDQLAIDVVSASAGTGKTYRLTTDYSEAITAGVEPEGIMAVTFTTLAAGEISSRVRTRLLEQGLWEEAQRALDGYVGTIHAVCGRLLAEFAFESGLSPTVDVIGEQDAKLLFAQSIAAIAAGHDGQMREVYRRLGIDDWRDVVRRIVEQARANRLDADAIVASGQRSWKGMQELFGEPVAASGEELDRALIRAMEQAIDRYDPEHDTTAKTRDEVDEVRSALREATRQSLDWKWWAKLSNITPARTSKDLFRDLNEAAARYMSHPRLREDLQQAVTRTFDVAAEALEHFQRFKKESGLVDFADQEALTLELLENETVCDALKEKLATIFVDEFQDTSPIQLALLLRLASCAKRSIWIGDQKQSIYGFRGTDPMLMDAVIAEMVGEESVTVLDTSYRSRPELVDFANKLFTPLFEPQGIPERRVAIRSNRAPDTSLGSPLIRWSLESTNIDGDLQSMATGIVDLLARGGDYSVIDRATDALRPLRGGDIAVLLRSNDDIDKMALALGELGVRVSVRRSGLLECDECILAFAALRYLVDSSDTLAAAEILHYASGQSEWFAQWMEARREDRRVPEHPLLQGLDVARKRLLHLSPPETLELALTVVGVERVVLAWSNGEGRIANIDALRGLARSYEELALARRTAGTAAGLIAFLQGEARGNREFDTQPESSDPDAVNILTYWRAKGLEWPLVILGGLQKNPRPTSAFDVPSKDQRKDRDNSANVVVEPRPDRFDPADPLAGRWLRWWPYPFKDLSKNVPLLDIASTTPEYTRADQRRLREEARLLYVGVTRARDYLVLPMRASNNGTVSLAWFDRLQDGEGGKVLEIEEDATGSWATIAGEPFPLELRTFSPAEPAEAGEEAVYLAPEVVIDGIAHPRAHISASDHAAAISTDAIRLDVRRLWDRLPFTGATAMADVGEAVHRFLAIDRKEWDEATRLERAEGLLRVWRVESLGASALLDASNRLREYVATHWPDARWHCEIPLSALIDGSRMHGWIDLLLETQTGNVIIDYKSFPGGVDAIEAKAIELAPQLLLYRRALEQAGRKVEGTLFYLPIGGVMVDVVVGVQPA